jgi:hypothetical protein
MGGPENTLLTSLENPESSSSNRNQLLLDFFNLNLRAQSQSTLFS